MVTFLDPWADPQGGGFQVVQALIAVGSGGPNGLGFAQGKQKMLFLPFAHSDFIFAVVSEELGLVGGLAVILVFGLFLWRGVRTALLAPDRFGMLLSFGIVTSIVARLSSTSVWSFRWCQRKAFHCRLFPMAVLRLFRLSLLSESS
jgi:cell division protein FtsW